MIGSTFGWWDVENVIKIDVVIKITICIWNSHSSSAYQSLCPKEWRWSDLRCSHGNNDVLLFWDVMTWRFIGRYHCFGETYCLHLQELACLWNVVSACESTQYHNPEQEEWWSEFETYLSYSSSAEDKNIWTFTSIVPSAFMVRCHREKMLTFSFHCISTDIFFSDLIVHSLLRYSCVCVTQ
jgi:hypothetical protein